MAGFTRGTEATGSLVSVVLVKHQINVAVGLFYGCSQDPLFRAASTTITPSQFGPFLGTTGMGATVFGTF